MRLTNLNISVNEPREELGLVSEVDFTAQRNNVALIFTMEKNDFAGHDGNDNEQKYIMTK